MSDDNHDHEQHKPFQWHSGEFAALAIALAVLAVLVLATVAFGLGGLITVMLGATVAGFVLITILSRG